VTLDIKQRYNVAVSTDRVGVCAKTKKLSYRGETARCILSVEILPIATQQFLVGGVE